MVVVGVGVGVAVQMTTDFSTYLATLSAMDAAQLADEVRSRRHALAICERAICRAKEQGVDASGAAFDITNEAHTRLRLAERAASRKGEAK